MITHSLKAESGKNCAIVGGRVIIADAKITGTTPAGFIFKGR
jgi:hypothetical protein